MSERRRCILNCPKVKGVKLYAFPKDEIRHQVWLRLIGMEHICITHLYLCARHFSSDMCYKSRLIDDAVPDINLKYVERPIPSLDENKSLFQYLRSEEDKSCTKLNTPQVIDKIQIKMLPSGSQPVKVIKLPKNLKIVPLNKIPSDPIFVQSSKLESNNMVKEIEFLKGIEEDQNQKLQTTAASTKVRRRSKDPKTTKTRTPLAPLEMRMATRIWQSKECETETQHKLPTLPTKGKTQTSTQPNVATCTSVLQTKLTPNVAKEKTIAPQAKIVRVKNIHDVESEWKEQAQKVAELTENAKTLLVKDRSLLSNKNGIFHTMDSNNCIIEEHTESKFIENTSFSNNLPTTRDKYVQLGFQLEKSAVLPKHETCISNLLCDEVIPNEDDLQTNSVNCCNKPRITSDVEFISFDRDFFDFQNRKFVSERAQTGTNMNYSCGFIQKNVHDSSFELHCFYCESKYPISDWQLFVDHAQNAHQFEMNLNHQSSSGGTQELTRIAKNQQALDVKRQYTSADLNRLLPHSNIQYALVQGSEPKTFALMPLQKLLDKKVLLGKTFESEQNFLDNNKSAGNDEADENESLSSMDTAEYKYNSKMIHLRKTEPERVMQFLDILRDHPLLWHTRRYGPMVYDQEMEIFIAKFDKNMTPINFRSSIEYLRECHRRYMPPTSLAKAESQSDLKRRIYFEKLTEIEELSKFCTFRCDRCPYFALDQDRLDTHKYLKHNIGDLKYPCSCGVRFAEGNKKDAHELLHKPKPNFMCELCGMSFLFNRTLLNHMNTKHTDVIENPLPYKCTRCDARFPNSQARSWHALKHSPPRFNCNICGQSFLKSFPYNQHMKKHFDQRDHVCETCGKAFVEKRSLIKHRYRMHNAGGYRCEQCATYYKSYENFFIHNQLKHPNGISMEQLNKNKNKCQNKRKPRSCCSLKPRIFKCKQCGMEFERQYQLMRHKRVLNHYMGESYYKCCVCAVVLKSRVALVRHLRCLHDQPVSFSEVSEKDYSVPNYDNSNLKVEQKVYDETEYAVQTINYKEEEENIIVEVDEITEIFEEFQGEYCVEEEVSMIVS